MSINNFIKSLPKAELHLHIEGTLEPSMMLELSKKNNINIPFKSLEEIKCAYNFNNLQSFLDLYYAGTHVLITEQDFFDLTWVYLLKCKEENIVHTEMFFDPQSHTSRGVSFNTVITGIHKALIKGREELGVSFRLIMCFLRHLSERAAFDTLEIAMEYKDIITAIGLDSSEMGHPPSKFARVFQKAREEGFLIVAHAGEEGPSSYIWEALELLEVKKIDHGVRCVDDKSLMQHLKQKQIPLTICPLSNIKLCVFDHMFNHNIKDLLDSGIMVTINSDDPSYFGGYLNENYLQCYKHSSLTKSDIVAIAKNSFKASFLDKKNQDFWIKKIDEI